MPHLCGKGNPPDEIAERASSLLKNSKNESFILWWAHCWDDVFESLRRFGSLDARVGYAATSLGMRIRL